MIKKEEFIVTDQKYKSGIGIDRYNNEIQLVVASEGADGTINARWCFPEVKREPAKKAIPWKLSLGVKAQAVQRLEQLLYMVEHGEGGAPARQQEPVRDDVKQNDDLGKLPF